VAIVGIPVEELTKEEQLVINCARVKMSNHIADQTKRLCSPDLNWNRILSLAGRHGLCPLLYHSLRALNLLDRLDSDSMNSLQESYYSNAVRNLKLYEQLKEILMAFNEAGIETVILKGAALAEPVYGNIALRIMSDIDLLIRKEYWNSAHSVMNQLGYSNGSKRMVEWYEKKHHHLAAYTLSGKIAPVEIHHHIFAPIFNIEIGIEDFWRNARSAEFQSIKTYVFSQEDLILHLCFHTTEQGGKLIRLSQLCDISEVLSLDGEPVNWERIVERARNHSIAKNIYTSLYLVRYMFGNERVPSAILARLNEITTPHFNEWLRTKSFKDALDSNGRTLDQVVWLDRYSERFRFLFKLMRLQFERRGLEIPEVSGIKRNIRFLTYLLGRLFKFTVARITGQN
jgi:hypothetical protein